MSLEEKVGQMILARSDGYFLHENAPAMRDLKELVEGGRIGGLVFFRGEPFATVSRANYFQDKARWPLLMASDYEWGTAFRVDGSTRFPSAMAIGAGGDEEDVRFQAEVTAREARALGIHLVLAPVVDLNVNPANSVINYRSYGEDPKQVSRFASVFVQSAQDGGVLATAKHFPGHGPTAVDSHLTLPVIGLDIKRLEDFELAPFRAAIESGVAAVMTAHIAVPALDGRHDRPATFSSEILEGVLRQQMGFEGLIVSDALDMGGTRQTWWEGEVAVAAVRAGCDLLLVPPDPVVAWDSVLRAVRRGEISTERINRSVMRILEAKARLNLHRRRIVDPRDIPRRVGDPRLQDRLQQIADRSVTLLENRGGVIPLPAERPPRIHLVSVVHENDRAVDPSVLEDELEARTEEITRWSITSSRMSARDLDPSRFDEEVDIVVVASYARTRSSLGRGDLRSGLLKPLEDWIGKGGRVVLASLGNPYVLNELPRAAARMAAYDFSPLSQRAVARALFGETTIEGRLPVSLSERYPLGHGVELRRRNMELERLESPEEAGFSTQGLTQAVRVLEEAVRSRAFPGAVAIVGRRGKLVLERAFGRLSYEKDAARVTIRTLYDLSSLTKVVATTTLAMILEERGQLVTDKPVREYIPEFAGQDKDRVKVSDLLAHTGGILWTKDLYRDYQGLDPQQAKKTFVSAICQMPLDYPPRSKGVYSDLGFILLGEILERVSGRSLEELTRQEILEPLGMNDTMFNPPAELLPRIAPTENDSWRGRVVHGEVHDENAFVLGGVAAHAGLFSTAADLARFAQAMLSGGTYGSNRILRRSTIERFTRRSGLAPGSDYALGWDRPSRDSSSGHYFSQSSYGHLGFTGTSLWIDPETEVFVVLLTNRVHPSRGNDGIRQVRPAFHDAVMEAITDMEIVPRAP